MRRFLVVTGSLVVLMFAATTGWAEVRNPYAVAVIIGNKTYENREVPEVKYAERDAQAIKNYVIDVLGYWEDNIIYLSNATQSKMLSVFGSANDPRGRLAQWLRPGGKSDVLVYYSGHGVPGLRRSPELFAAGRRQPQHGEPERLPGEPALWQSAEDRRALGHGAA